MLGAAALSAMLLGLAILLVLIGIGRLVERRYQPLQERLDALAPQVTEEPVVAGAKPKKQPHPLAGTLNRLLSTQRFSSGIATELARADLPLTVAEYVLVNIGSASIGFLLASWTLRRLLFGLLGAAITAALPTLYLKRKQSQREVAFQAQLPDTLTLVVGSLRSGYGLTMALDAVSKQMPEPSAKEFGRVVREIGLSVPTSVALSNLVRRIRSDDLDLVATAIGVQYEMGGNLATVLESIAGTIRERIRLKQQVRVLTAQQQFTRLILTFLPVGLGIMLYILSPQYMSGLFTPGVTLLIPIGATVLVILGHLIMSKLSQIEV